MAFFHFSQNNSGGVFQGPAHHLVIEGTDAAEANDRAEDAGAYFDGCDDGRDCSCCGDRWSRAWERETPDNMPLVYGKSPEDHVGDKSYRGLFSRFAPDFPEVLVFYTDGTLKEHRYSTEAN